MILIISCKTTEYVYPDYKLPETPNNYKINETDSEKIRNELSAENDIIYQTIILGYISNIEEWEQWAKSIKKIIDNTDDK